MDQSIEVLTSNPVYMAVAVVLAIVILLGVIKKLLNNYRFLLQDLREGHTLLFVMHVFFVGGAVLTLLLVLLFSGFRLLF